MKVPMINATKSEFAKAWVKFNVKNKCTGLFEPQTRKEALDLLNFEERARRYRFESPHYRRSGRLTETGKVGIMQKLVAIGLPIDASITQFFEKVKALASSMKKGV